VPRCHHKNPGILADLSNGAIFEQQGGNDVYTRRRRKPATQTQVLQGGRPTQQDVRESIECTPKAVAAIRVQIVNGATKYSPR
jgi:hypothetical protein